MGIKGLTSFVQQNSRACMEKFELHDTDLVIDGDSTAYQLYCQHFSPKNCCFGGDYDRYSKLIKSFFQLLLDCKIRPIFIFDGGYDDRKIHTIETRMRERIIIGITIDGTSKDLLFPLFLGKLLQDTAMEYKFPVVRCDYEGDLESASIAKSLNCPVLSNDSDFYIFDVLYVPFSSLQMRVVRKLLLKQQGYYYIPCELYRTEKFLEFMKLTSNKLPLFATILGNDYLNRIDLKKNFRCVPYNKGNQRESHGHRYIKMLAAWLQHESNETAIEKILDVCNSAERQKTANDIQETIKGYICRKSKYMFYINSENTSVDDTNYAVKSQFDDNKLDHNFLKVFLKNSRKCNYPSCFMNMLMQNTYYIRPQVEDDSLQSSHIVSINIISAISRILKNCSEQLQFFIRIQRQLDKLLIPSCSTPMPTYLEIQELDLKVRENLLLDILHIKNGFVNDSLIHFPDSWKLYIISIKYLCEQSALNWSLIQALLLCKIVLGYIDKKIGYFRNSQEFNTKHKQEICKILISRNNTEILNEGVNSIFDALNSLSNEDCLIAQKNLITFFEMKSELRRSVGQFNRKIVHAANQFQSCFYHIGFLNSLLKSPYNHCSISESFNGTFIYNFTSEIRAKANENYIAFLLQNAPSVLNCLNLMITNLKEHLHVPFLPTNDGFNL